MTLKTEPTKHKDITPDLDELSSSIADGVLEMKILSAEDLTVLIKTRLSIFYSKQHIAHLSSKIANLEKNINALKFKAKGHNLRSTLEGEFFRNKYEKTVTREEMVNCFKEIQLLRNELELNLIQEKHD